MPIQAERIARDLAAFAQIGASGPTAVSRLALGTRVLAEAIRRQRTREE